MNEADTCRVYVTPKLQAAGWDREPTGSTNRLRSRTDGLLLSVCARIKEQLLKEFNLHTVVRLPNGVFAPYTGIPTNILFFDRSRPTEEIWYYEHPLPEGRKNYTKTQPLQFDASPALNGGKSVKRTTVLGRLQRRMSSNSTTMVALSR